MSSNDIYVTGLFPDRASAERAYQDAHERGYDVSDVNMVMNDETRSSHSRWRSDIEKSIRRSSLFY